VLGKENLKLKSQQEIGARQVPIVSQIRADAKDSRTSRRLRDKPWLTSKASWYLGS